VVAVWGIDWLMPAAQVEATLKLKEVISGIFYPVVDRRIPIHKSPFIQSQTKAVLKQTGAGAKGPDLRHERGINSATSDK
jgi:hypothetical protein